ncbi:MAG: DUF5677 domain-containing protein [Bdellovibrionota bacterium]
MKKTFSEELMEIIQEYQVNLRDELESRFGVWPIDVNNQRVHEVIGALLARQVTLADQLANSPSIWNNHAAPLFHRAIADVYISLAWISKSPEERSQKFIEYGLGQVLLQTEHRKAQMKKDGIDSENDPIIEANLHWVDTFKFRDLVEVNVGAWSGLNTREMAEQAECIDFYNYVYTPFSGCVHSTWHQVSRLNTIIDPNPLHNYLMLPYVRDLAPDIDDFLLAAKYVKKSFRLFTDTFLSNVDLPCSYDRVYQEISDLGLKWEEQAESMSEATEE